MRASIDLVVPTYNNLDELRRCLDSLLPAMAIQGVLVCVDGSTDGTLEYLAGVDVPFPLTVLEHPDRQNHGRAATRNLALGHLTADHVLLLDSDMRVEPDTVDRHVAVLESEANVVSIGSIEYLNARESLWARYQSTRGMNKREAGARIRPLDFVTANTALRTADLVTLGGFDETLTGYGGEDTDLGLRLAEKGLRFIFNADARATTVEHKTVAKGLSELRAYARINLHRTRARHPDGPAPYWIDRADSKQIEDRLFRLLLNRVSDRIVDLLLPRTPWPIQRRLLNYKVIRAVFSGYREGGDLARSPATDGVP